MKVIEQRFQLLVAFSGSMIARYQRFADISMGIGMIIAGLASVIIGEVGVKSIQGKLCAVVIGPSFIDLSSPWSWKSISFALLT